MKDRMSELLQEIKILSGWIRQDEYLMNKYKLVLIYKIRLYSSYKAALNNR